MSQNSEVHRIPPRCCRGVCEFTRGVRSGFIGDLLAAAHWLFAGDARARKAIALVAVTTALLVMALVLALYVIQR